jgi:hypothetical protein
MNNSLLDFGSAFIDGLYPKKRAIKHGFAPYFL